MCPRLTLNSGRGVGVGVCVGGCVWVCVVSRKKLTIAVKNGYKKKKTFPENVYFDHHKI